MQHLNLYNVSLKYSSIIILQKRKKNIHIIKTYTILRAHAKNIKRVEIILYSISTSQLQIQKNAPSHEIYA